MSIEFGLLILAAYLLGSVPAAYLAARFSRGIDLRRYGTGQVGAGNLWRTTSWKFGLPVGIFDLVKGMAMVWAAQLMGLGIAQQVAVGLAVIIGHNWPVFLRFNGGRGVATTLGVVFILMPWGIAVFCAIASVTILLKSSPLPVLVGIAVLPLVSWFFGQPLGIAEPLPITLGLLVMFLIIVIRRLTAPLPAGVSVDIKQLLLNRLLFDRDIRDGKAWVRRVPPEASSTEQPLSQQENQRRG